MTKQTKAIRTSLNNILSINLFFQAEGERVLHNSKTPAEGQIEALSTVGAFLLSAGRVVTGPPPKRVADSL